MKTIFILCTKQLFIQLGFRHKHSTTHTLIKICDQIQKAIDKGQLACGVFIDLQKAFDTVNHKILLSKLSYYGVRGNALDWFKSYLTMRTQHVTISGSTSENANIIHGVSQGSVLGPLLFLIYINDLHKAITRSTVHHFADDTNLLYSQTGENCRTDNCGVMKGIGLLKKASLPL